jgi:hypothetical protein
LVNSAEPKRALEADDAMEGESTSKKQKIKGTADMDEIIRPAGEDDKETNGHSHPLSAANLRGELCTH